MSNQPLAKPKPGNSRKRAVKLRPGAAHKTVKDRQKRLRGYQEQILDIQSALWALFRRASPRSKPRDLSWVSAGLAGLWEVSVRHKQHIRSLMKCSYPRDRSRIEKLMTEILVNMMSQGASHIEE